MTSLRSLFPVQRYEVVLNKICKERDLKVKYRRNLIKVEPEKKIATFKNCDTPKETETYEYSFMNVTPPMHCPACLKKNKELTNKYRFLWVHPKTLRHMKFGNIFGIGDCICFPSVKTAAAICK